MAPRIKKFELLYRDNERSPWQVCLRGAEMGESYAHDFPPVTARFVRLNILDASDAPTIWEFQLFPPGSAAAGPREGKTKTVKANPL